MYGLNVLETITIIQFSYFNSGLNELNRLEKYFPDCSGITKSLYIQIFILYQVAWCKSYLINKKYIYLFIYPNAHKTTIYEQI